MRSIMLLLLACRADPVPVAAPAPSGDFTEASHTGTPTGQPGAPVCPTITAFELQPTAVPTAVRAEVTVDPPGPVAVRCVPDAEPGTVLYAQTDLEAAEHTLVLEGLLPGEDHTCAVTAMCSEVAPTALAYHPDSPPTEMPRLTPSVDPELGMTGVWTLAPVDTPTQGAFVAVWDALGRVRWWWPLPEDSSAAVEALVTAGTRTLVVGGGYVPEGRIRTIDLVDGETYAWAPAGWPDTLFHHDAKALPDGRLLTLESRSNSVGSLVWEGFGIRVHDPTTGVVDVDINSQSYVDDGTLPAASDASDVDPYHANWVDLSPDGDVLYVSICKKGTLLALDLPSGSVRWQLGVGRGWSVSESSGNTLSESVLPQCQHGVQVLGRDHLLVYDNGRGRGQSFAQEWRIDGDLREAELLWSWTEPGWFDRFLGDIDLLDGNRVLLTQAKLSGSSDITEVDRATGGVASRFLLPAGYTTYRAERYDGCALFTDAAVCPELGEAHARNAVFFVDNF